MPCNVAKLYQNKGKNETKQIKNLFLLALNWFLLPLNWFLLALNWFLPALNWFLHRLNWFLHRLNWFLRLLNWFLLPLNWFLLALNWFLLALNWFLESRSQLRTGQLVSQKISHPFRKSLVKFAIQLRSCFGSRHETIPPSARGGFFSRRMQFR